MDVGEQVHFLEPLSRGSGTPNFDAVVGMLHDGTAYSIHAPVGQTAWMQVSCGFSFSSAFS